MHVNSGSYELLKYSFLLPSKPRSFNIEIKYTLLVMLSAVNVVCDM